MGKRSLELTKEKKKENDEILYVQTEGEWEKVRMIDVAKIAIHWFFNDENLYNPKENSLLLGGRKFFNFLNDSVKDPKNIVAIANRNKLRIYEKDLADLTLITKEKFERMSQNSQQKLTFFIENKSKELTKI